MSTPPAFALPRLPRGHTEPCGQVCLEEVVGCSCGEVVRAGEGHPDCPEGAWLGYWLCECGHCSRHHRVFWDMSDSDFYPGGASGMACDTEDCDCPDPSPAADPIPH